jgi:hypothetical protein
MRIRDTTPRSSTPEVDAAPSTTPEPRRPTPGDTDPDELLAALPSHDEATRLFAQSARAISTASDATTAASAPRMNDRVLYVGMNSEGGQSGQEERGLAIPVDPAASHATNVRGTTGHVAIGHSERDATLGSDRVRVAGEVVDLATGAGAAAFAASLGLPAAQARTIAQLLTSAPAGTRDELAGIAAEWAKAERGGECPSRLVVSGHCDGKGVWGNGASDEGTLAFSSLFALARAMPRAASFVEDVMLSACSSGYDGPSAGERTALSAWKQHFPNLRTAWGYGGKSDAPGAYRSPSFQQAVMHVGAWEKATRGRVENLDGAGAVRRYFDAARARNPTVDAPQVPENVSVWTVRQGYVQGEG